MLKKMLVVLVVLLSVSVVHAEVYEVENLKITYENPFDLALAIPAVQKARDFFTSESLVAASTDEIWFSKNLKERRISPVIPVIVPKV